MGRKIVAILFIIILIGIVMYVVGSGALNKLTGALSSFVPHISSTTSSQNVSSWNGSKIYSASPSWTSALVPGSTSSGGTASSIAPTDIPTGYTATQLSPFFHKIRFGTLSAGGLFSSYGQISLYDYADGTITIDVTGWQIKSNRSGEYIPTAVNLYDPSGLAATGDILLQNGQTLNIYSNTSPFNLRLNKCIGYIQNANHFNPALPYNCPYPSQSDIVTFTGVCQQFIYSLNSCALPDMNSISIPQNDYACRNYLNALNYGGCFNKHANDSDFLSNEWRVWAGSNVIDPIHDTVLLLDRNGLLVDLRTY